MTVPENTFVKQELETTDLEFSELGLAPEVLRGVEAAGFKHPTPVQRTVIPSAIDGRDLVGLAETGSGKTAAFCLPMVQRLRYGKGLRGLVVSPTREIAMQTHAFLELFREDMRSVCVIGGVGMGPQIRGLSRDPAIVVATPGRLLDHAGRGNLSLGRISELVLDEGDHMFDLGFLPQIGQILQQVPRHRHTMLFSATMPPPIERLAHQHLRNPVTFDLRPQGTASGIKHRLYMVAGEDKQNCVLEMLRQNKGSTLVFARRKVDAEWLSRVLSKEGYPVERIHSDLSQQNRVKALEGFREGEHRILVATDIAARGIDVPGIDHIVNYDLPSSVEDYIHRAGRTARGSAEGTVSSIATWRDKGFIRRLESRLGESIPRCEVEGVDAWEERESLAERRKRSPLRR